MCRGKDQSPGGGGGTRFSCGRGGGGGAAGGRKPDPVAMRSVHKKYTLSQYTLLKMFICIPCRNIAPSLVPDRVPVINIVGWEALGSNPVINGVARQ